jgi:hypothetical protein
LRKIEVCSKTYYGQPIFRKKKNDIEITIYLLNLAYDKFLVLQKQGSTTKDFVVTGIDKVYDIMDLLENTDELNDLKQGIAASLDKLEQQCYLKSLKKVDSQKLRSMICNFYDNNYPMFTVLGIRLPELLDTINGKAAI